MKQPLGARADRLLRWVECTQRPIAARKLLWIALAFALPLSIRLALLPAVPVPQPAIQDEFCYLLAGDTFASGRLTNQPHPLWVAFEGIHLIQQPTYMVKYPPLMGLTLAVGQVLFAEPWIGVLLAMCTLCAVLCWALQQWLPPLWAVAGTTFAILKIGILSYWTESYWGGSCAAIGGTLLIGSIPRMIRRPGFLTGLPAAIGIAILMNSRPLEGLAITAIALAYASRRIQHSAARSLLTGLAAPILAVMLPVGAWSLYYNYRITGDPLRLPYTEHESQYVVGKALLWQQDRPFPVYRHEAMRELWTGWDLRLKVWEREHLLLSRWLSFSRINHFYWGIPILALVLSRLGPITRSRRLRPILWMTVVFFALLAFECDPYPHYAAPATALAFILSAAALRSLRYARNARVRWGALAYPCVLTFLLATLIAAPFDPLHRFLFDKREFLHKRVTVLNYLASIPAKHLVFVRYGSKHEINEEWVYNRADLDHAGTVWARSMTPEADLALCRYFPNRQVWLLDDNGFPHLSPYAPQLVESLTNQGEHPNATLRAGR